MSEDLTRLERDAQDISETAEKIKESAETLSRRIAKAFVDAGFGTKELPTLEGMARYRLGDDSSLAIDMGVGDYAWVRLATPEVSREAAMAFAQDIAKGLVGKVAELVEAKKAEGKRTLEILDAALAN